MSKLARRLRTVVDSIFATSGKSIAMAENMRTVAENCATALTHVRKDPAFTALSPETQAAVTDSLGGDDNTVLNLTTSFKAPLAAIRTQQASFAATLKELTHG